MFYLVRYTFDEELDYCFVVVKCGKNVGSDTEVMYLDEEFHIVKTVFFPERLLKLNQIIKGFEYEGFKVVSNDEFIKIRNGFGKIPQIKNPDETVSMFKYGEDLRKAIQIIAERKEQKEGKL